MRDALTTLPWVEADSIKADKDKRQARFKVTDRGQFDKQAVADAIRKKGYDGTTVLSGPTEK